METIRGLEDQLEDLKKQFWDLVKNKLPELEAKIESSTPDEGEDSPQPETPSVTPPQTSQEWQTIYDKDSEDSSLNLGFQSGIIPMAGAITDMQDLNQFNFLRVHWMINTVTVMTTLNIGARRDLASAFYILTNLGTQSSNIVGFQIVLNYNNEGKRVFNANTGRKIQLSNGSYPSYENLKGNTSYYIFKIEAMV